MKAKELRIGNLVDWNGESAIISQILEFEVVFKCGESDLIENIKPIPLTEENLRKFGFEKQKTSFMLTYSVRCKKSKLWFTIRQCTEYQDYNKIHLNEPKKWWSFDENKYDIKVDFVHQIQNIFNSFTREELTLTK